jgi:hypothetical protein
MTDSRDNPPPELRPAESNNRLQARGEKYDAGGGSETGRQFAGMTKDEIARIPVLSIGATLEQGSVYLDLDDLDSGPFVALGSEAVAEGDRMVAKRDADYEMWNRLAGDREPRILKPA